MALQVWLPLNGDLKNKGVADVNVTNSGATVDSNGKIGQCYKFGTSASYVDIPKEAMNGFSTEASVCFWLKINTFNTAWATYFQAGLNSTAWTHYIFGFLRNNSTSKCCFAISDTSTSSQTSYLTPDLSTGVWYHFAITYKPGHCCIYVNGTLYRDYSTSITADFSKITRITLGKCSNRSSYQTDCCMNDLRIYDHCLSAAEVKEISRGLVLHYKLDDPLTGVVFYDYLQSTGTQWIDTGIKGYMNHTYEVDFQQIDTGNYRIWGVFGQSSYVGYNMSLTYGGGWSARWNNTSNGQALINLGTIDTNRHIFKITNGQCYFDNISKGISSGHDSEFSIDNNLFLFTINPANTTPSSNSKCKIYSYKDIDLNGKLIRYMVPCTYNGVAGMWDLVEEKFYGNSGTGDFSVGTKQVIDKLVIDSSGYGNHGIVTGNLSVSSDSPKYQSCALFDGSNSIIKSTLNLCNDYKYTASFWIKPTSISNATQWIFSISNGGNNHQFGCYINKNIINTQVGGVVGTSNTSWAHSNPAEVLQHIAIVSDGADVKLYINGSLFGTNTVNGSTTGNILWLGQRAGSPNVYNYNGILSDFRIYATALSAEDIKQLYEVSAKIDNLGNFHTYEFVENENNKIEKVGVSDFNLKERTGIAAIYKQVNPNLLQGTEIDSYRYERTSSMGTEFGKSFTPTQQLETGTYYTFSAMIRGNANMNLYTINTGGNVSFQYANKEDMDENEFKLFSVTFRVTGNRTINKIYPCSRYGKSNTLVGDWYEIQENSVKLEEGSSCTPWIPAETDENYRNYNGMLVANQFIEI